MDEDHVCITCDIDLQPFRRVKIVEGEREKLLSQCLCLIWLLQKSRKGKQFLQVNHLTFFLDKKRARKMAHTKQSYLPNYIMGGR
jgi:hypothetical protein